VQAEIVGLTKDLIDKFKNEIFVSIERRLAEMMGRIDALVPGERGKDFRFAGEKDEGFKFSNERDDGPVDLPNPLKRRGLN
jgi:hypothetical protein